MAGVESSRGCRGSVVPGAVAAALEGQCAGVLEPPRASGDVHQELHVLRRSYCFGRSIEHISSAAELKFHSSDTTIAGLIYDWCPQDGRGSSLGRAWLKMLCHFVRV